MTTPELPGQTEIPAGALQEPLVVTRGAGLDESPLSMTVLVSVVVT
ncbi:hypothetical protein [Varibaculum cambriense]|nr:hypothetical protein [Varibaculum cambriense]